MTVSVTSRLGITRWDNGGDPFTRQQLDDSHAALENTVVGFVDSTSQLIDNFVSWNGITKTLSYCDGSEWHVIYSANPSADLVVTGNIIVGGTVDGRDVAADGLKLDGIEAGADVTDSVNVAAAVEAISFSSVVGASGDKVLVIDASDGGFKAVVWDDLPWVETGTFSSAISSLTSDLRDLYIFSHMD